MARAKQRRQEQDLVTSFDVYGPYAVPLKPGTRLIETDQLSRFWRQVGEAVAAARGCYVFGIRTGRGLTPCYVGKATRQSFKKEVFADHKLAQHYFPVLGKRKRGRPVMFFLVEDRAKGRPNSRKVGELERFLVQTAEIRNPDLSNSHYRDKTKWAIHGVTCECRGAPPASAAAFNRMLKY